MIPSRHQMIKSSYFSDDRLAESCSHVGAMLYTIETAVRMRETVTCTMEKSKWLMPSYVKKVK
jgi:hypothetical protein